MISLFRKLTKVSTNNFRNDFKGIPDPLELKFLLINHLEILSRVHRKCIYTGLTSLSLSLSLSLDSSNLI